MGIARDGGRPVREVVKQPLDLCALDLMDRPVAEHRLDVMVERPLRLLPRLGLFPLGIALDEAVRIGLGSEVDRRPDPAQAASVETDPRAALAEQIFGS